MTTIICGMSLIIFILCGILYHAMRRIYAYRVEGDQRVAKIDALIDRSLVLSRKIDARFVGGVGRIALERHRQKEVEGWTPEHDEMHVHFELSRAAQSYCQYVHSPLGNLTMISWPWADKWWKPSYDPIRNLEKAGALIAAEIDRIERARKS